MELRQPAWELKQQRCSVCKEGELIFAVCTSCNDVVLICAEEGSVFQTSDLTTPLQTKACQQCGSTTYPEFRNATATEIQARGYTASQYQ
jgi:hypothetical protein